MKYSYKSPSLLEYLRRHTIITDVVATPKHHQWNHNNHNIVISIIIITHGTKFRGQGFLVGTVSMVYNVVEHDTIVT